MNYRLPIFGDDLPFDADDKIKIQWNCRYRHLREYTSSEETIDRSITHGG